MFIAKDGKNIYFLRLVNKKEIKNCEFYTGTEMEFNGGKQAFVNPGYHGMICCEKTF